MDDDADGSLSPAAREALQAGCICLSIRKTARIVSRMYDEALGPHGLTIGQFGIMAHVASIADASVQELADRMGMDQSALSRGLKPLEQAGLVASRLDGKDKRRRVLALTALGARRLDAAAPAWKRVQDEITARFGTEATAALQRDLKQLRARL